MADRSYYYASIVYPESAPENWIEILEDLHIPTLISPLHDKDRNKDGTLKKKHWHVIYLFESLKSEKQAQAVADKIGGIKVQIILCLGAYTRYLCHLDDADKAQYNVEDVKEIAGANFIECSRANEILNTTEKILTEITEAIINDEITYFHRVVTLINAEHPDWYGTLIKYSYYVKAIVMSVATELKEERTII